MYAQYISFQSISLTATTFRQKALAWANQFPVCAYYNNNNLAYNYQGFEPLLAVCSSSDNLIQQDQAFESLGNLNTEPDELLCGILSYDLKNQVEKLTSHHSDKIQFPLAYFFKPTIYINFHESGFTLTSTQENHQEIIKQVINTEQIEEQKPFGIQVQHKVDKSTYLKTVEAIRKNIEEGEIYEMNYCIEFFAENVLLHPLLLFQKLNLASPMPFAGYFKLNETYLLCASPERFLKKEGDKLISQPIKGTIRRGQNKEEDAFLKSQLRNNEKEIGENMMIMDLVRNDLSKSCQIGSVKVEEMFGIYSFQHVFQMITTVSGKLKPEINFAAAIKNAFPMGSMTGAPKIRAMQLIEEHEASRRGMFSGSFGYIKGNGDFDFNVVIRSLQYNATNRYLSFMVGSAITYDSVPEQEYEECLLKAKAMMQVLQALTN
ncbi:anthranilate synthase component I family protein [Adhaeribacter aquaticus]|uniref:anthranilate synthase component I family protein n=1 Tax=Adhaeribacter aquaticus TaxID=299567 RepID=UPI000421148B|nr:anthranilate synthase component I family protein [Adhaeribacter aquaticus]